MDNTHFSKKCEILNVIHLFYDNDPMLQDFIEIKNLSLPLASLIHFGYAVPTEKGKNDIEETWNMFCDIVGVDPYGRYEDTESLLDFAYNE